MIGNCLIKREKAGNGGFRRERRFRRHLLTVLYCTSLKQLPGQISKLQLFI